MIIATPIWFVVLVAALGAAVYCAADYWYSWQDYQAKNNKIVKFAIRYWIAGLLDVGIVAVIAYEAVTAGNGIYDLAAPLADWVTVGVLLAIGGFILAIIVDRYCTREIADGKGAQLLNKIKAAEEAAEKTAAAKSAAKSVVETAATAWHLNDAYRAQLVAAFDGQSTIDQQKLLALAAQYAFEQSRTS